MANEDRPTPEQMKKELASRFETGSQRISAGAGTGLVWDQDEYIGLDTLLEEWFGEEWFEELEDVDDFLGHLGTSGGSTLVSQMVDNPGPPSWYWSIETFQIGDRGYIHGNLSDVEYEPLYPIFAAWEPYEDDSALFETLKASLERHYEIIGTGNRINADGRLGREGFQKLAASAIEQSDQFRFQVEVMIDQEDSGLSPEDLAATWIKECWRDTV
jgi:hypothetical protein